MQTVQSVNESLLPQMYCIIDQCQIVILRVSFLPSCRVLQLSLVASAAALLPHLLVDQTPPRQPWSSAAPPLLAGAEGKGGWGRGGGEEGRRGGGEEGEGRREEGGRGRGEGWRERGGKGEGILTRGCYHFKGVDSMRYQMVSFH